MVILHPVQEVSLTLISSTDCLLVYFRWHRVVISHRGQEVDVTLDSGTQRMQAREGHQHLHMDPAVFFGGMETSHTGLGQ